MEDLTIETLAGIAEIDQNDLPYELKYNQMLDYILRQINKKGVFLNSKFQRRFYLMVEYLKFEEAYFTIRPTNPLQVYAFALADQEVFTWVEAAYNKVHKAKFSKGLLQQEIKNFEDEGATFLHKDDRIATDYYDDDDHEHATVLAYIPFKTKEGNDFDIFYVEVKAAEDGKMQIVITIDIGNEEFKSFIGYTENDPEMEAIFKRPTFKDYSALYKIIENQIYDQVSDIIDKHERDLRNINLN